MIKILSFIILFFVSTSLSLYTFEDKKLANWDNNAYGGSMSGCTFKYLLILNDSDSKGFNSINGPMVNFIESNSQYYLGQFNFDVNWGMGNLIMIIENSVGTFTNLTILENYHCEQPPYPIPLKGSAPKEFYCPVNAYILNQKCSFKLEFAMNKTLGSYQIINDGAQCYSTLRGTTMILLCSISTVYQTITSQVSVGIKDQFNRITPFTLNSFIKNNLSDTLEYEVSIEPNLQNVYGSSVYYFSRTINNKHFLITTEGGYVSQIPLLAYGTPNNQTMVNIGVLYSNLTLSIVYYSNGQLTTVGSANFTSFAGATIKYFTPSNGAQFEMITSEPPPLRLILYSYDSINAYNGAYILNSYEYANSILFYKFPFGIVSGNYKFNTMKFSTVIPKWTGSLNISNNYFTASYDYGQIDQGFPSFVSIEWYQLSLFEALVRIEANDTQSGVRNIGIYLGSNQLASITTLDLVSGSVNNGVFEKKCNFKDLKLFPSSTDRPVYQINDHVGNLNQVYTEFIHFNKIPTIPFMIEKDPSETIEITYFRYKLNGIDLSKTGCNNTLYFDIDTSNPKKKDVVFKMSLSNANFLQSDYFDTYGQWNYDLGMFQIDFYLPPRLFSGPVYYNLYSSLLSLDSISLYQLLGKNAELIVYSEYADLMPPSITKVIAIPGIEVLIDSSSESYIIGWNVTVEDPYNGFNRGFISILSDVDGVGFNFSIVPSINPNEILTVYEFQINFTVPLVCYGQKFYFDYVELVDNSGYIARGGARYNFLSPFMHVMDNYNETTIELSCEATSDIGAPEIYSYINSLNSDDIIDVTSDNRSFTIQFSISDTYDTPISLIHVPSCWFFGMLFESFQVYAELESQLAANDVSWICRVTLPYGFGSATSILSISIYGYADTLLNFGGVSSYDIQTSLSKSPIVKITTTRTFPIIESSSKITSKGGQLILYGYNFLGPSDTAISIAYDNATYFSPIVSSLVSSTVIVLNITQLNKKVLNIRVTANNAESNIFVIQVDQIIDPITSPPPKTECKGSPECGGPSNGQCTVNGCVCIKPWIGVDCLSQVIVIPSSPTINTTKPDTGNDFNTTLPDGNSITLKSLISIISLDEVKPDDSVYNSYVFKEWVYTNSSSLQSNTNIEEYKYEALVLGSKVTVTVQYYKTSETIYFANEKIDMLPSSLKYKIEIKDYNFHSVLNHLQLRMSASLEILSPSDNSCSYQESGINNENIDYIKLQIDNHSLYGRYIRRAVIDNRIQSISNTITKVNSSTPTVATEIIGINIPYFRQNAVIDPDFSVLIDTTPASDNEDSICNLEKSGDDNSLSKSQLAGIIIGAIGFVIVIIISITYYIYKKNQQKQLSIKLQKMYSK